MEIVDYRQQRIGPTSRTIEALQCSCVMYYDKKATVQRSSKVKEYKEAWLSSKVC